MRVTLLWPFGTYKPGAVVDIAPEIATVLTNGGFARTTGEPTPDTRRKAPTVDDVVAYATAHDMSLSDARRAMATTRTRTRPNT